MQLSFVQIIKLGRKLIYLQVFIVMIAACGYWHLPQTLPIIGGIMILSITVLPLLELETRDVHFCTLEYEEVH